MAVVNVDYHGTVTLVMAVNEAVPCQFDMTDFPRDTQTCNMHLIQMQAGVSLISAKIILFHKLDFFKAHYGHSSNTHILHPLYTGR